MVRNIYIYIFQLVSMGCSLSTECNITDLLRREKPEILTGIEVGYGRKWLSAYKSSNRPISEMGQGYKVAIENQYEIPIRAFDWCKNRPSMTLKGHYAFCFKTRSP